MYRRMGETEINSKELPSDCSIRARVILGIIGVLAGLTGFLLFSLEYQNKHAAGWAMVSGMVSMGAVVLHMYYKKGFVLDIQKMMRGMTLALCIGALLTLGGVTGFVWYLILAYRDGNNHNPYGRNYYFTLIWSSMVIISSLNIFLSALQYRGELKGRERRILMKRHQHLYETENNPVQDTRPGLPCEIPTREELAAMMDAHQMEP